MFFLSRLFCNKNCCSSLCQNVRMKYVNGRGDESCEERNDNCGCENTCERYDCRRYDDCRF